VLNSPKALATIAPDAYARDVLPLTAPLWAGRRTFDEYVEQTLEIARSPYGRRYYRTNALYDGARPVSSFKRYERAMHHGSRRLRAFGIGAVFTPPEERGRGYASVMLALALDRAKSEGFDVAYLFSDIRPQFYANLGFVELPSRRFSLRADALPAKRLEVSRFEERDWSGASRAFELGERRRIAGFLRSASVWGWIRMLGRHGGDRQTNLVVRRGRSIAAYVLGTRDPERDAYVLEEFGFGDDSAAAAIPPLLRAAAGDLRRVVGWSPPGSAARLLRKGHLTKRTRAILMMAPLTSAGARLIDAVRSSAADFCWPNDHI